MRKIHKKIYVALLVTFFTLGSAYFAFGDYYQALSRQLNLFNELYKELVVNYVDQVDPDALIEAGINGMLETLDPYTVYMEKEEQHGIKTLTEGRYGGVGIRLGVRNDTLTVIAPMEGSPAMRAGIQAGDKIIQIDTLRAAELRLSKAAEKMRGKPGTVVTLTILRPGYSDRIPFALERDNIVVQDLAYADYIDDGIGYFKLTSFSKNSDQELKKAFKLMEVSSMRGMILDLRDNPGGLLASALEVADLFIEPGIEVLTTKGRTEKANKSFQTREKPIIPGDVPIAVLVNDGSASASEIVAGVLQDLDRAVIIGQGTFGKGLVQTVIPLSRESSVKITTAKYYIPSGRLIQKQDYFNEEVMTSPVQGDSIFYTQNHRKVYGGGGINPDIPVAKEVIPKAVSLISAKNKFFSFTVNYHNRHENRSWPFAVNDSLYEQFMTYLQDSEFEYLTPKERHFNAFLSKMDSAALARPELNHSVEVFRTYFQDTNHWKSDQDTREWIYRSLEREFAQIYGGTKKRIHAGLKYDSAVKTARKVLQNDLEYQSQLGWVTAGTSPEN